jgi:radical SAM superfamily enzyme YgiQ (UPF0313 family)
MVYKKGPPYRVRPVNEIKEDLDEAKRLYGSVVRTVFFPAGNTIAMPADDLADICSHACSVFPDLDRITVYGSSRYIYRKGLAGLEKLKQSGMTRIHVGLESGSDEVLGRIKKGTNSTEQIQAGLWVKESGIELSEYVILGIGGKENTRDHALKTADVLNAINPDFIRFRTFLPKTDTLLLHQIKKNRFQILSPHEVLEETKLIIENLDVSSSIHSDHYTNYIDVHGRMPYAKRHMIEEIDAALKMDESCFRSSYVGSQ